MRRRFGRRLRLGESALIDWRPVYPYTSVVDLVDKTIERHHDPEWLSIGGAELIVSGQFESVQEGRSFTWVVDGVESPDATELAFGDDAAMINVYYLTFIVDEQIAPHPGDGQGIGPARTNNEQRLLVSQVMDPRVSTSEVEKDYLGLEDVVLSLNRPTALREDRETWSILNDGALLATVEADGTLSFPAAESGLADVHFRGDYPNLALDDLDRG